MKRARIAGLIACVLVLAGIASGGITTVKDTQDYTANGTWGGTWFIPPDVTLDHSPYYRGMWEDWGWTHSLKEQAPSDALGIQSATLSIRAWDVDGSDPEGAEVDIIYANGIKLGVLNDTKGRFWGTTTFELPAAVLTSLWLEREVYIDIDIDTIEDMNGQRVTLESATLTVEYGVTGEGRPSRLTVHRFWSPVLESHFYTALEWEKEKLVSNYPDVWTYEGVAYHVPPDNTEPNSVPVYRFWSPVLGKHLFTMDIRERNNLINEYSDVWVSEGIAFYTFPVDQQPAGTVPVYRLWSEALEHHLYTVDAVEKDKLLKEQPEIWADEGIAWYAYQ